MKKTFADVLTLLKSLIKPKGSLDEIIKQLDWIQSFKNILPNPIVTPSTNHDALDTLLILLFNLKSVEFALKVLKDQQNNKIVGILLKYLIGGTNRSSCTLFFVLYTIMHVEKQNLGPITKKQLNEVYVPYLVYFVYFVYFVYLSYIIILETVSY